MKILFAALIAVMLVFSASSLSKDTIQAQAITKPSVSRFNSVVVREKDEVAGVAVLAAKRIFTNNGDTIGNAFSICTRIAAGQSFGSGVEQCHATFNLPRGKIVVMGTRHTRLRYTWVVIGGTGFYNGVGGRLEAFQTGTNPRTERLAFYLSP